MTTVTQPTIVAQIGYYSAIKTRRDPTEIPEYNSIKLRTVRNKSYPRYITGSPNTDNEGRWYWILYGQYINDTELQQFAADRKQQIKYRTIQVGDR